MQQHPWRHLPSLILCTALCTGSALCAPDSAVAGRQTLDRAQETERTLFIGFINFDCYQDTVRGWQIQGERGYLPHLILWGQPRPGASGKFDPPCATVTPAQKQVRQTRITYPAWAIHDGSAAFHSINGDTLTDIVLHLHERIHQGEEENDSLHSFVIFGQHGLDSLPVIHVGQIRRFQAEPFFAMELAVGAELDHPGTRDLSGAISYILEPVHLEIDRPLPQPAAPSPAAASITAASHPTVQVYPNPTTNTIRIEATQLPAGDYVLQLISVNGTITLRQDGTITPGDAMNRTLDVQNIPSGYYVFRIGNAEGEAIGTYPIIITR